MLVLGFSVGDVVIGACFCDFVGEVTWPQAQRGIFWFKFCWNLGHHLSL